MKRVVITGMGAITPIGNTVEESWAGIKDGKNGIEQITHFPIDDQKSTMGGEVKDFVYPDKRAGKRLDRSSQLALVAAREAVEQSGLVSDENVAAERFGVVAGSGIGGIMTLEDQVSKATLKGDKKEYRP